MEQEVAKFSYGQLGALPGATRWPRRRDASLRPMNCKIRTSRVPGSPTVNYEL